MVGDSVPADDGASVVAVDGLAVVGAALVGAYVVGASVAVGDGASEDTNDGLAVVGAALVGAYVVGASVVADDGASVTAGMSITTPPKNLGLPTVVAPEKSVGSAAATVLEYDWLIKAEVNVWFNELLTKSTLPPTGMVIVILKNTARGFDTTNFLLPVAPWAMVPSTHFQYLLEPMGRADRASFVFSSLVCTVVDDSMKEQSPLTPVNWMATESFSNRAPCVGLEEGAMVGATVIGEPLFGASVVADDGVSVATKDDGASLEVNDGLAVVGDTLVGARVDGASLEVNDGLAVVEAPLVGARVDGDSVDLIEGFVVLGIVVVGDAVVGAAVVGDSVVSCRDMYSVFIGEENDSVKIESNMKAKRRSILRYK